jgi:hypothetical protein
MRVYVSQIYIEPGISYPFTHVFQKYLSSLASDDTKCSEQFRTRYGEDYDLIFNVSAKTGLVSPEIKGPTVFKREKTVEYTVFLPFQIEQNISDKSLTNAIKLLLNCMNTVLSSFSMTSNRIAGDTDGIARRVVEDPNMIHR